MGALLECDDDLLLEFALVEQPADSAESSGWTDPLRVTPKRCVGSLDGSLGLFRLVAPLAAPKARVAVLAKPFGSDIAALLRTATNGVGTSRFIGHSLLLA